MNNKIGDDQVKANEDLLSDYEALRMRDPRLWARFWAKQVDLAIFFIPLLAYQVIIILGLGMVWDFSALDKAPAQSSEAILANVLIVIVVASGYVFLFPLLEALMISVFGATPGKAIFGIDVRHLNRKKLTFGQSLKRTYSCFFFGLGLMFPIITLVTMWLSKGHVESYGITRWDDRAKVDYQTHPVPWYSWLIGLALIFICRALDRAI